jgi:hypothetical protein
MDQSLDTNKFEFPGNYRAIVEDNEDPLDVGRVRVRVIGIHSLDPDVTPVSHLPWAEPALSIYYSGGQNLKSKTAKDSARYSSAGDKFAPPKRDTEGFIEEFQDSVMVNEGSGGFFVTPRKGTQVWVFFDCNYHGRPQYWGSAVKGKDWEEQKKKLENDIKLKTSEISNIRNIFVPDTKAYKGASCSSEAKVGTAVNKPKLTIQNVSDVRNYNMSSWTSPGGVTYIAVNEDGREKTYIMHKGYMEYTDDKGQRKVVVGFTDGKANDLEQAVANNFELHIGGDFDIYVKKSHYIQVDGDAQINVKGNAGIRAGKDIDLISDATINIDAGKNINIHAKGAIQYHAEGNMLGKVDGNYDLGVKGVYDVAVKMAAKFKSLDLHMKATTSQVFEAALQQTMLSTTFVGKAKTMFSIASDAVTRINAGAGLQQTAPVIDLAGMVVNVGGAVMLGSASSQPPPQVTPPTSDAESIVTPKQFAKSGTPKNFIENQPNPD